MQEDPKQFSAYSNHAQILYRKSYWKILKKFLRQISNSEILIFFSILLYSYMEQLGTNW